MTKGKKEIMKLKIGIGIIAAFVVGISVFSGFRGAVIDSLSAVYGSVLVALANDERSVNNAGKLTVNSTLERAAQMKADDMAQKGYFAHNTPDGKTPWYWFEQAGYKYKYAGENLAVNFTDSTEVHTAWTKSRGHFLNIINPRYTEIGIATSTGMYKGREAVFVVQMFGTPE